MHLNVTLAKREKRKKKQKHFYLKIQTEKCFKWGIFEVTFSILHIKEVPKGQHLRLLQSWLHQYQDKRKKKKQKML